MSGIEWVLSVCSGLAVTGICAIVGIVWKMRTDFFAFATNVEVKMATMETKVDEKFAAMTDVVTREVNHLTRAVNETKDLDTRIIGLERQAATIAEAHRDYIPWRANVDRRLEDLEGRE